MGYKKNSLDAWQQGLLGNLVRHFFTAISKMTLCYGLVSVFLSEVLFDLVLLLSAKLKQIN